MHYELENDAAASVRHSLSSGTIPSSTFLTTTLIKLLNSKQFLDHSLKTCRPFIAPGQRNDSTFLHLFLSNAR